MRHVADGDLHAILDDQLGHYPPEEAERIRRHLDACVECRARLDEERAVHGAAAAALGSVDTGPDEEPPPFEELERRARARRRGSFGRTDVLRMAATAVVALGVGWVAGRMGPGPVADRARSGAGEVARETAPAYVAPPAPEASAGAEDAAAGSAPAAAEAEQDGPRARDADVAPTGALASPGIRAPEVGVEEAVPEIEEAAPRREVGEPSRLAGAAPPALALAQEERGEADALPVAGAARTPPRAAGLDPVRRALSVEDLPVLTVEWLRLPQGVQVVHVVQALDAGRRLELWIGGLAGSDGPPESLGLADVPEGASQVVVRRDGDWIVARGPLDEARLRELVERIR